LTHDTGVVIYKSSEAIKPPQHKGNDMTIIIKETFGKEIFEIIDVDPKIIASAKDRMKEHKERMIQLGLADILENDPLGLLG